MDVYRSNYNLFNVSGAVLIIFTLVVLTYERRPTLYWQCLILTVYSVFPIILFPYAYRC